MGEMAGDARTGHADAAGPGSRQTRDAARARACIFCLAVMAAAAAADIVVVCTVFVLVG